MRKERRAFNFQVAQVVVSFALALYLIVHWDLCSASEDSSGGKAHIKLPTFSGKQKDYAMWILKFLAFATFNKFLPFVQRTKDADLPDNDTVTLDLTNAADKKTAAAMKLNS